MENKHNTANKLTSIILANSICQRPAVFQKNQDKAVIAVRMIVPNLSQVMNNTEYNTMSDTEKIHIVQSRLAELKQAERLYVRVEEKISLQKEDSVWTIPDVERKAFEKKILEYSTNNIYKP